LSKPQYTSSALKRRSFDTDSAQKVRFARMSNLPGLSLPKALPILCGPKKVPDPFNRRSGGQLTKLAENRLD